MSEMGMFHQLSTLRWTHDEALSRCQDQTI